MIKILVRVASIGCLLSLYASPVLSAVNSKTLLDLDTHPTNKMNKKDHKLHNKTEKSSHQDEDKVFYFQIQPYKANYILPAYYTSNPYYAYYDQIDPDNTRVSNFEINFQFSIKFELWKNFFGYNNALYFGYTQLAFWQAYQSSAFFRENDFQPEVFFRFHPDFRFLGFQSTNLDAGFVHQSNGVGGDRERSWNRLFVNQGFKRGNWLINIQLWTIFNIWRDYNKDIADYLGYGDLLISRTFGKQRVTLYLRNQFESNFSRGAEMLTWSYLLQDNTHVYFQAFSGYGQCLGEYDHYTNGLGIGISFGSW